MRRAFQGAMRDDLVAAVERLTGRTVEAFLSDNLHDPDVAVEIFLLHPIDGNGKRLPPGAPTDLSSSRRNSAYAARRQGDHEVHRLGLKRGVVLGGAVIAARHGEQAAARRGRVQAAGVGDRHALVALGVHEQQARAERARRVREIDRGQQRLERGAVGAEVEAPGAQAVEQHVAARRADRHDARGAGARAPPPARRSRPSTSRAGRPARRPAAAPPSSRRRRARGRRARPRWRRARAGRRRARRDRRPRRPARSRGGSPCTSPRRAGSRPRRAARRSGSTSS